MEHIKGNFNYGNIMSGAAVGLASYSILYNKKEKKMKTSQKVREDFQKQISRNRKAKMEIRRGLKEGTLTRSEAREECMKAGLDANDIITPMDTKHPTQAGKAVYIPKTPPNYKKSSKSGKLDLPSNNTPTSSTDVAINSNFNNSGSKKISIKDNNDFHKLLIANPENLITEESLAVLPNSTIWNDDILSENSLLNQSASKSSPALEVNWVDCLTNDEDYVYQKKAATFSAISGSPSVINEDASYPIKAGLAIAILVTGILFLKDFSISRLKEKYPKFKEFFRTREDYFLESHAKIHKKLNILIEKNIEND